MGDTVNPAGWRLDAFRANPQALWSHKSDEPPIGRACNVAVEGDRLMGDIEFASADVYPFADQIFRLVKAGFLNTVSVGFMPIEYEFSDQAGRGIDFLEQELLEISVCPVPANANALVEVRSWRQRRAERRARRAGLAEIEAVETRTEAELIATARHYQFRHLPPRNLDTERGRLERAGDIRRVLRMPDPVDPRLIHAEVVSRTFRW
jgi:HK97 family phage prohead protease